ncbi:MAG TPA: peptidoglycan DD-metalloendopeptidase family protein [Hyphomonadaceae bacterium]|nr:peptidoglycan DD-metalloendopeptidase family protein [Hyphomonadaceae bacterium]
MRRLALALMLLATPALAQSRAAPKSFTQDDLKRAEAARDSAVARLRTLEARSSAAARDLGDIDADLIAAAADSTAREEAAYAAEEQLMILADETQTASSSLSADQAALDDLLAALMTFGSRRPPALATSPEDSAAAVRAAILMSDAAPALSRRATELKSQIETLNRLAAETRAQQTNLASATGALAARREEIAALAEEKRRASATLDAETAAARAETRRLATEADTLRELLDSLAKSAPAKPSMKPSAGKPPVKPTPAKPGAGKPSATQPARPPAAVAARPSAGITAPLQPAVGTRLHRFGQTVDGEKQQGLTLSTRPAAQVIAPLDARVQYSGVFRSYGLMAILDVGNDVLVVVSGLDALFPEAGQWVLAGEPIGRMADRKSPSPELYLEVRRKGQPVDPEKWLGPRT